MNTLITILTTVSMQQGLPHGLLESVCWVETKHNPNAIHRNDGVGDSIGLCQIKLKTSKWLGYRGTAEGLLNPKVNAYWAGKYLQYQIKRHNGNTEKAVIAYNIGNAKGLTTTAYSVKVFKYWRGQPNVKRTIASTYRN